MNIRLVCRLLGLIALLIGGTMIFSLPWAFPALGQRTFEQFPEAAAFEYAGFLALLASVVICLVVAALLWYVGRDSPGHLYRKEAMAVVGLSWVLATVLGAMPFYFSGVRRCAAVRVFQPHDPPQVYGQTKDPLSKEDYVVIEALLAGDVGARGLTESQLKEVTGLADPADRLRRLADADAAWQAALMFPGDEGPKDRRDHYRIRWVRMGVIDSLFESQSGFSTTGATVLSGLEDPVLVPHCILFWRSSTHFLGGLGIIVLFVAILGQGSAGKALMRAEMPGPSKEGSQTRMQHAAWVFALIYCALNGTETVVLKGLGMTWFDALCHAFGTMATGGFSTYNASMGAFESIEGVRGAAVEYTVVVFMFLAGTNFTLLYFLCIGRPNKALGDVEWRAYAGIVAVVTALVVGVGLTCGDFSDPAGAVRYGLFQVVSIMTTTGYGTADFDSWNNFARGVLLLLMFIGGCAGSTGGGLKVIRHILFVKILRLEVEHAFHPRVVRPLRLGGKPVDDPELWKNILVYFGLILIIFVASWIVVVTFEPDGTWGTTADHLQHKLIDSAATVAATLNNIGPGLGVIGSTQTYTHFSGAMKLLFTWLMMLGRLEIFVILVLFVPSFWRNR